MTKEEFAALCNEARAALDDLAAAAEEYKAHLAKHHDVRSDQIQLFVTKRETRIEAIIRPLPKGAAPGW